MKTVSRIERLTFRTDAPGLSAVNIMASEFAIEPFLVFTEFHMNRQVFGPHPHAGISVLTYILPDSLGGFRNRDSNGDDSQIEPGGLHITQAGRGVHHDEFPLPSGVDAHGFQIWVNHRANDRFVEPRAMHASAAEIVEVRRPGIAVRVLLGALDGHAARHALVTPVTLLHVLLEAGASVTVPSNEMTFAYVVLGSGMSNGASLSEQTFVLYDTAPGDVELIAGARGLSVMIASGTPLGEPILYGGPFVMTTREQMVETKSSYARGDMGTLLPVRG